MDDMFYPQLSLPHTHDLNELDSDSLAGLDNFGISLNDSDDNMSSSFPYPATNSGLFSHTRSMSRSPAPSSSSFRSQSIGRGSPALGSMHSRSSSWGSSPLGHSEGLPRFSSGGPSSRVSQLEEVHQLRTENVQLRIQCARLETELAVTKCVVAQQPSHVFVLTQFTDLITRPFFPSSRNRSAPLGPISRLTRTHCAINLPSLHQHHPF